MTAAFWETMTRFEISRAEIDKGQFGSCQEMHDLGTATRKIIANSRELIRRVDEILDRDMWWPKPQAK